MALTPILLFTYKRLEPLKKTVEALQRNFLSQDSDLFIFSDGPKQDADKEVIGHIRTYLKTITGFKSVTIQNAVENKGLATSIINGVTSVLKTHETVIVLEDDLLTTPNFLSYMNAALEKYKADKNVFSISGYSFDLGTNAENSADSYFLNRGWSWGWGTWKNRWQEVDWQVKSYDSFRKNSLLKKRFAKGGSDLNKMLRHQMKGKLDSWAIRWFYHQFTIGGLTLFPVKSKVYNNGFDKYATHTKGSSRRYIPVLDELHSTTFSFPPKVGLDDFYYPNFCKKMSIASRIKSKVETIFKQLTN